MSKTVDYYFAIQSPFAYLGSKAFEQMVAKRKLNVRVRPIDLTVVFPRTGGVPLPKRAEERKAYRLVELKRWSKLRKLKLVVEPKFFPADAGAAARMIAAANLKRMNTLPLAHAMLAVTWADNGNIADQATLEAVASKVGFDGPELYAAAQTREARDAFDAYSREALERGVFGSPTYIYRKELFFGQDRLDFLDRALA
jgi:2-hydroxychromene-2-carboxylate isomerase